MEFPLAHVYPQLEEVMSIWVDQQISRNLTINGPIIQQKAVECANLLDITNFSASAGWLSNFKQRNNLHTYKKKGEAGKPSKTIAHDPVLGKKCPKERVSILATCNASGDERLPLVFIHKYETPRALKGIEKRSLPVWYYWNSKAWMQRSIFKHYLERLNSKMLRENQHIILLIDNARCHESENINSLSNVKVHFLPPNTTSFFQPLDQGIIYSLKAQYRKLLCQNRIQAYDFYEEGDPIPPPIDIFDSINLIADAWKKVSKKTILNSWARAGILPNNNMEDSECSDNSDYEEDNIGHELQSLIDELGFVDPLAVNDYINIDNRASAEEELSLQEIVDVVKRTNKREIEEKEEQDEISTIVALNSIENVIKYIQQKDLEIGNLEMKNLIKLKKRIFFDNINEKKQSKLNEYFDFNV
ncbi:tigger transposable element-derived protein 4-like [Rhizophagus irregularis DAOM 181602=DAOM 197198]|nr:tigger transposable element-derived protein 4-like [Rhizophagus irregularis DAOM 181602=DAOM 197198]